MRLLLYYFLVPVLLFGCALLLLAVPLPSVFPPPFSRARNLPAALMIGFLAIVYLIGLVWVLVNGVTRPSRQMNDALSHLNFQKQNYMLFGNQYDGVWQGRPLQIQFVPGRQSYTLLQVYLPVEDGSRAALGRDELLLDCRDCERVQFTDPVLHDVWATAESPAWLQNLMDDSTSRNAVDRLLNSYPDLNVTGIYLQPERVWLYAHPTAVPPESPDLWLADLTILAEAVEANAN